MRYEIANQALRLERGSVSRSSVVCKLNPQCVANALFWQTGHMILGLGNSHPGTELRIRGSKPVNDKIGPLKVKQG